MSNIIKAIDLHCKVLNWDNSVSNAFPDEVARWSRIRDRHLEKFRSAMVKITREEFLGARWLDRRFASHITPMEDRIKQWDEMQARAEEPNR